jgi:hypothetical protein
MAKKKAPKKKPDATADLDNQRGELFSDRQDVRNAHGFTEYATYQKCQP